MDLVSELSLFSKPSGRFCHAHMSVHASSKLRRSLKGWVFECGVGRRSNKSLFLSLSIVGSSCSLSCMARTLGPIDKYGNGITLQLFVLALRILAFVVA
jgi:hypothetical protein